MYQKPSLYATAGIIRTPPKTPPPRRKDGQFPPSRHWHLFVREYVFQFLVSFHAERRHPVAAPERPYLKKTGQTFEIEIRGRQSPLPPLSGRPTHPPSGYPEAARVGGGPLVAGKTPAAL